MSEIAEINAVAPRSPMHMKRAPKPSANLGCHLLETQISVPSSVNHAQISCSEGLELRILPRDDAR